MLEEKQFRRILNRQERRIRRVFTLALEEYKDNLNLSQIIRSLEAGNIPQALVEVETVARTVTSASQQAFISTAQAITASIPTTQIAFNVVNDQAVSVLRTNDLRFVRNFTEQQIAATRLALTEGVREGLGPRALARSFRDSIGLTEKGEASVRNYRRLLQRIGQDDIPKKIQRESLSRALRDRRSDSLLRRLVREEKSLTAAEIDRMVGLYRDRAIKHRALTIARTEALSSVHQGQENAIREAIQNGKLNHETLVSEWLTRVDGREREWHEALNGVMVPYGTAFENEKGLIMHPGDRSASAENIINCRCVRTIRIRSQAFVERLAA